MKILINSILVISLTLLINSKSVAQEEDSVSDPDVVQSQTFYPDGSDTIKSSKDKDDLYTEATNHKDTEGNITETATSIDFQNQRATHTTRTNTNNPDFDASSKVSPDEVDENDESRAGVAVFNPDGSSLSQTKVKRADGGEDTEIIVQGVEGSNVAETAEKSLKVLRDK